MLQYNSKKRPTAAQYFFIKIRILKHEYFSSIKVPDQNIDPHNETKFSFYEKEVIEIPKNIKV
jgi:hypothetical protein